MFFAVAILSGLLAGALTWTLGAWIGADILRSGPELPPWLQRFTPLKGRWLRLALAAPGLALGLLFVFAFSFGMLLGIGCIVLRLLGLF